MSRLPKKNVLVVEDEDIMFFFIDKTLNKLNINLQRVKNGNDALHAIENSKIDLIIMDLQLPGINGIEIIAKVNADFTIPIIVQSAYGSNNQINQCKELGCADFLTKPYNFIDLLHSVYKYI